MSDDSRVVLIDYDPDLFDLTEEVHCQMATTIAAAGARLEVGRHHSEESVTRVAAGADIVMVQSTRPLLTAQVIGKLARCRGIIRMGLGFDSVDVSAATARGIPVSNVTGWCNDEVAEHAIALLLAGVRRVALLNQQMHSGLWRRETAAPTRRLRGKTVGIIGFGPVGRAVAERLHGFGVSILVADPYVSAVALAKYPVQPVKLAELLARADYVTVHARLTPDTYHLLGPTELACVKPGMYIVNTSRGALIDEAALLDAIKNGRVSGAALDVMESEPLPAESPLRACEYVTLTPHIASYSIEAVGALYQSSAEIAAQLLMGQWVPTIVNPELQNHREK